MTIEKYLALTRDFIYGEDNDADLLKAVLRDFYNELNIELIIINSDISRNEAVVSGTRNYLIWDESFWTYYNDHMYKLLILDEKYKDPMLCEQYLDFLISDQIRFVIHKLKYYDKNSAIILAKYYVSRFKKTCKINFDTQNFHMMILLSKLYVLFHECSHFKYKDKSGKSYIERAESTIKAIKLSKNLFANQLLSQSLNADKLYTETELSRLLDSFIAKSDGKNLEELVFDSIAFSNCLTIYYNGMCNGNFDVFANRLSFLVNSVRVLRSFSKMLKLFDSGINVMIKNEDYISNIDSKKAIDEIITRNSLSLYVEQIQTFLFFIKEKADYPTHKITSAFCSDEQRPYKFVNEKYLYPYINFILGEVLVELLHDMNNRTLVSNMEDKDKMIDFLMSYSKPKR